LCASFLHQFVLIMNTYSHDYNNCLPSFPSPDGPHVHNLAEKLVFYIKENYGLEHNNYFCPNTQGWRIENALNRPRPDGSHFIIGYNYWVPRFVNNYNIEMPAEQNTSFFAVIDTKPFSGPRKAADTAGRLNPVMTDQVAMKMSNPLGSDISKEKYLTGDNSSNHRWNDVIDMTNQGFIDGHVEKVDGSELKIRYGYGANPSGSWIWR
jgi:hypothetical protein